MAKGVAELRKAAAERLLKIRAARENFLDFVKVMRPEFKLQPFHLTIIKTLDALEKGILKNENQICRRLMINMPPRHGKSTIATKLFVAYYMGRKAKRNVIQVSYAGGLAGDMGGETLQICQEPIFQQIFPTFKIRDDKAAKDAWGSTTGSTMYARGFGQSTTGLPANCLSGETLVLTPTGSRKISQIKRGDHVLSFNHGTGKPEFRLVQATQRTPGRRTVRLTTDGGRTIRATPDHPIFCGDAYLQARDCQGEDVLALRSGPLGSSASPPLECLRERCTRIDDYGVEDVFDLQVEGNHNFFANGILVHNCLIIDDPVKNHTEANSPTARNNVWNYYVSSCVNRKEPLTDGEQPIEIVILTRWHVDDLGGRLMNTPGWKRGEWRHLLFRAINEVDTDLKSYPWSFPKSDPRYKPRPRPPGYFRWELPPEHPEHWKQPPAHWWDTGKAVHFNYNKAAAYYGRRFPLSGNRFDPAFRQEWKDYKRLVKSMLVPLAREVALWPEQKSLADLKIERELNEQNFTAQYQQSPYIRGGNILKQDWWRYWDPNEDPKPPITTTIITADTAFKANATSDYNVIQCWQLTRDGDIRLIDQIRARLEFPDLKEQMVRFVAKYRSRGLRGVYIEDKASGQSLIQELRRESGLAVYAHKVVHDKVARLNAVTPLIHGGRVFLKKDAEYLDDFLEECLQFPSGQHDDQVDAMVIALDVLGRINVSFDPVPVDLNTPLNANLYSHSLAAELKYAPPPLGA